MDLSFDNIVYSTLAINRDRVTDTHIDSKDGIQNQAA